MNKYTLEQLQAINTDGTDILVSAAAGSGKTAVLVERIMRLVTKSPEPVDIDRLLVVTFTEAAAGEMRSRISDALTSRLHETPDDVNLHRQLSLLGISSIMTIHAFCLRIVHRFFSSLDIDPGFRIADETERKLIKSQVIAALFEEEYSSGDNDFFNLAESYGGGKTGDGGLEELVLDIYEFISSNPWPKRWLNDAAEMFSQPHTAPWMRVIQHELMMRLNAAKDSAIRAIDICYAEGGPKRYVSALESDIEFIDGIFGLIRVDGDNENLSESSMSQIYDLIGSYKFASFQSYTAKNRDGIYPELIERVKYIRENQIKKVIASFKDIFIKPPQQMFTDASELQNLIDKLKNLVLEFMSRYNDEKRDRSLLDFNDLEHYCLKIMLVDDKPSIAARIVGEGFDEVLIDEYQDSNLIQELILSSLGTRRFMVGDVKQSIYKFRHAMPEIFLNKYKNPKDMTVIDLSKNFRSRSCVLDGVNILFGRLMKDGIGGIEYDSRAKLYYGANYPDTEENVSHTTELAIIDTSKQSNMDVNEDNASKYEFPGEDAASGAELEAEYVASRILDFIGSGRISVWDNKDKSYRPARFGDIAVLVRSAKSSSGLISDILSRRGIPAHTPSSGGFLNASEIKIALGLLQIIDNPRQDIQLLAVLRSPIYRLSPDDLINIRRGKEECYFDNLVAYVHDDHAEPNLKERILKFLKDLDNWRNLATYSPIDELLDIVYDDSGLMDYAAAMTHGEIRTGNLRILKDRAAQFEETSYRGLFHFMRYIEKAQNARIEMNDARLMSETGDHVRVMTIHGSKGLEFPIVFVCGLGRRFNLSDENKMVVSHQTLGFGPCRVDLDNRVRSRTLPQMALGMSLREESLAEELRVLYVAATRAREKLIFVGSSSSLSKKLIKWDIYAGEDLPSHYVLSQNNYLDWIAPALIKAQSPQIEISMLNHENISCGDSAGLAEIKEQEESAQDQKTDLWRPEKIISSLEWKYPRAAESVLPVKVTISEIKRRYQAEMLTDKVLHITADQLGIYENQAKEALSNQIIRPGFGGVKTGTAMHTVIEHLDLAKHRTESEISILVNSLKDDNLLDNESPIQIDRICAFVNSQLADRIRASKYVRTESPFVMELHPYEALGSSFKSLDARLILHGIIDCFFEEDDGFVLVDYKSDFVTHSGVTELIKKYRLQLSLYARAIEARFRKPVKESLLYLFAINEAVLCILP